MGRLRVVEKLCGAPRRGTIALAQSDRGVLVADEEDHENEEAIELPVGDHFTPLPEVRPGVACHIHVAGPSGCGKSTWAGDYADLFRKHLGGAVVVISLDLADDPAIRADVRLPVSEDLAEIDLESIAGEKPLLLIFDDCDGGGKKLGEALAIFKRGALERGRKLGLSTINIHHRAAAGKETRSSLGEMTSMVVFPNVPATRNLRYALDVHLGVPSDLLAILKKDKAWGRAVMINMSNPPTIIGERKAMLLDIELYEIEEVV